MEIEGEAITIKITTTTEIEIEIIRDKVKQEVIILKRMWLSNLMGLSERDL